MEIRVKKHIWGSEKDAEVEGLLFEVFVGGNYTARETAGKEFTGERLKNRGTALIAVDKTSSSIAGVVFYVPGGTKAVQIACPGEAETHLLAVGSQYRRSGIGKALIAECLKLAARDSKRRMVLSTQPMMIPAHRLYESMGFTRNENRDWRRPAGGRYLVYEKAI